MQQQYLSIKELQESISSIQKNVYNQKDEKQSELSNYLKAKGIIKQLQLLSDETEICGIPWSKLKHKRSDLNWSKDELIEITDIEDVQLNALWKAQTIQGDLKSLKKETMQREAYLSFLKQLPQLKSLLVNPISKEELLA